MFNIYYLQNYVEIKRKMFYNRTERICALHLYCPEMIFLLFRKNIAPACAYCVHSSSIDDETSICVKKGITSPWRKCPRFSYDPLKRIPEPPEQPAVSTIDPDDFDLS